MNVNKLAREIAGLNAEDLENLTSLLMNHHGMSATLYHYSTNIFESPKTCDLMLLETGSAKLIVIKTIKDAFGMGLREAKDIMDSVPCCLKQSMQSEEAEKLQEELESIGAKTEIIYN